MSDLKLEDVRLAIDRAHRVPWKTQKPAGSWGQRQRDRFRSRVVNKEKQTGQGHILEISLVTHLVAGSLVDGRDRSRDIARVWARGACKRHRCVQKGEL